MTTLNFFQRLFAFKRWTDTEFLDRLDHEALRANQDLHMKAVRTLNHVHVVDKIFKANMQGVAHRMTALNTPETPNLDSLRANILALDSWYIDFAGQLDVAALSEMVSFTFVDASPGCMSREEMLAHVLMHSSHHRGQVSQILESRKIDLPQAVLTVFLNEHPART